MEVADNIVSFVQFTDGAVILNQSRKQAPVLGAGLNKGYAPRALWEPDAWELYM